MADLFLSSPSAGRNSDIAGDNCTSPEAHRLNYNRPDIKCTFLEALAVSPVHDNARAGRRGHVTLTAGPRLITVISGESVTTASLPLDARMRMIG
ncbi:hypothetical protein EVAR_13058_1 [Eumeta japonica]|uniref:Uncharacterized protein n=1 Tax=Eumeta variegata TaxID=151549 RepID=A0A4C1VFV7_EUMVA|nr:hypothetical protein EVAR_13058_1 [Eumeta japonica]